MAKGKLSRGMRPGVKAQRVANTNRKASNEAKRKARHAKRLAQDKAKVGVIVPHGMARALKRKASGKSKTLPKILQATTAEA